MGGNHSLPSITNQDRAILEFVVYHSVKTHLIIVCSLKLQRDKVKQYQKKVCTPPFFTQHIHIAFQIQVILDREYAIAKEHLANGQKDRAAIALRRRKYQQGLLQKTDQQLENLEQLVTSSFSPLSPILICTGVHD